MTFKLPTPNKCLIAFLFLTHSLPGRAADFEFAKLSDYKKIQLQWSSPLLLKLSDFAKDTGRGNSLAKTPNYRLLYESDKIQSPEVSGERVSCVVYHKAMLSHRVKSYAEEAAQFEKIIGDKTPFLISSETKWTVTKISPNDQGALLALQGEKKTLQMDCQKIAADGHEKNLKPNDLFTGLSSQNVKFYREGQELKIPSSATPL